MDRPRERALVILRDVEKGAFAGALVEEARRSFDARDSSFILELVYGVLRNRALLDWTLDQLSVQPVGKTDSWTRNILRLGAYQMRFLDRVPVSASVNTAAELAKAYGKKSGYVNGLLRNLDRKRDAIPYPGSGDPIQRLSVLHSHPEWLVARWVERFGAEAAETLLENNNRPAPLTIRTNTLKTTREGLKASLDSEGARTVDSTYSPIGLELVSGPGFQEFSSFRKGWFAIQDEAAQLISMMLAPRPGEKVLDACAAPGGKATHLAELMNNRGTLIALESDPKRIERIRENSARLGASIIVPTLGDATQYAEGVFDKVLIDAPCSGLGVLRRHPDGRWNKSEKSIKEKQALQKKILENCSKLVKHGGALVYATCTTEPEENENVIDDFLVKHAEFVFDDPRPFLPASAGKLVDAKGFFRTFPDEPATDGFFGARMVKK
ncbi:MAG TPA: 16S rRNA (cytosine(967)-C(5))-methyltransferase RsmB [Nitrospirota bacterium]